MYIHASISVYISCFLCSYFATYIATLKSSHDHSFSLYSETELEIRRDTLV